LKKIKTQIKILINGGFYTCKEITREGYPVTDGL
jgi:hypothetical protein